MQLARTSLVVLTLALASPLLRAGVLVVDAAGGGDFLTLSAAVAAAASGDTILVGEGEYFEPAPVVIDGKALAIIGEPPRFSMGVIVHSGLVVQNLHPEQRVLLENLMVAGSASSATASATSALELQDNQGHVRAQACYFGGGFGDDSANPDGAAAVQADGNGPTALLNCTLGGGAGQFDPGLGLVTGDGGPGLAQSGGQIHLGGCHVSGGYGGGNVVGGWPDGGDGGDGVAHSGGTLLVAGGYVEGGQGGTAHSGGDGGAAISLGSSGFAWLMADVQLYGGDGGGSDDGPDGADGPELSDPSGVATNFGGVFHDFDLTSPLGEGQAGSLDFGGAPTDATFLFASLGVGQIAMPGHQGVFVLSPAALLGPFVIGPPGNQSLSFVAPSLPAGLDVVHLHLQPAYVGATGARLGPGAMLTLLDASFSF